MQLTIQKIISGDPSIFGHYKTALGRWEEIHASPEAHDVDQLVKRLWLEQPWFEHNCGGRSLGQEVMVVAGIGGEYAPEIGFGAANRARARRVYEALLKGNCSLEVKQIAKDVGILYRIAE